MQTTEDRDPASNPPDEELNAGPPDIPLGIVAARIVIVSGMGIAGALAIFFLIGAIWWVAAAATAATLVFMFLMFAVERAAGR